MLRLDPGGNVSVGGSGGKQMASMQLRQIPWEGPALRGEGALRQSLESEGF